jgi:hypothetical protein
VPFVYSTSQPGRVEWTDDATTLWDRIANDQPLGKLRVGSLGADQVPTSGSASGSETPSGTGSPSDDESESESSSTSSASDSESSATESPSSTESASSTESPGIDASADDLDFAGLCS